MRAIRYLFITLLVCAFIPAQAQQLSLDDESLGIYLGEHLSVYEDVTGKQNVAAVMSFSADSFLQRTEKVPNLQISGSAFWAKLEVVNNTGREDLLFMLQSPMMDRVDLYHIENGAITDSLNLGEYKVFSERPYKAPSYIMPLNIAEGQSKTYLIRVEAIEQIQLPLQINAEKQTYEKLKEREMTIGIYVGLMIVLALYNLFIYFSVRDKSYLWYVLYVVFMLLLQLTSFGHQFEYLWPNSPWLAKHTFILVPTIASLIFIVFTMDFLRVRDNVPKARIGFIAIAILFIAGSTVAFLGSMGTGYNMIQMTSMIVSIYSIVIASIVVRKGYRPAKFYLISFTIMLCGVIVFILKDVGVLPYNNLTNYMLPLGLALEGLLLSFGLADRINILKKEKEESQQEALNTLQENERIIREQNVVLEQKVMERTAELQESNEELNVTLEHLKETQTQLVDSEKMASLGQLTAGIAHEINNPINFVAANVKPLRRDLKDIMTVMDRYSQLTSDSEIDKELAEIEDLKEELDTDFLKEEMEMLIQGIDEGASRTAEIVKGLRLFSRLDEAELKKANINEGIEATLTLVKNSLDEDCDVETELGEIPLIDCQPGKLNQLFMNIMNNGIQAIKSNNGNVDKGLLKITTSANDTHVTVRIADNGTGMNDETKAKIFEPFFTTKEVGEGTGLGLSIVYKIIETHDGTIDVNTKLGEGTEFVIQLPITNKNGE